MKCSRVLLTILVATMLISGGPLVSEAATVEPKGWIGGLFGLSIPNYENSTSRTLLGITGGAKLGTEWGVGGYFMTSQKDESSNGVTTKFGYDLYGVELAYHFEGEARGVYLGGRLGTSKVTLGDLTTSPMNYGAVAGYNHFVTDQFTLGGEANFMSVEKSSGSVSGVSADIKGFSALNFLASAKFWF